MFFTKYRFVYQKVKINLSVVVVVFIYLLSDGPIMQVKYELEKKTVPLPKSLKKIIFLKLLDCSNQYIIQGEKKMQIVENNVYVIYCLYK